MRPSVYEITEHYTAKGGPIIRGTIGVWLNGSLRVPVKEMWERRSNLGGVLLRDAAMPFGALVMESQNGLSGIFPDVLEILKSELNFSVTTGPSK